MPQEHPTVQDRTPVAAELAREDVAHQAIPQAEEWAEDSIELPRRPRRRLLAPMPLTLLAILLIACGFIGGVLVEKGQSSSGTSAAAGGLASRFAALRGGSSSATGARGGGAAAASLFGGSGGGRPTSGQVAYLDGSTLYVTNSEGNTVKVNTSAATTVTKTVSATVKAIHPGETVTVSGAAGSSGAISAESISVGSAGGLAALFGGGRGSAVGTGSGSGGPALFGGG